ncbi:MAG TPA: acetyl-CoA C-acyltransferase [Clostridiales bacterium]|nr:acetyl-CoA C-acyltransferase [Clostridiales bacterium]
MKTYIQEAVRLPIGKFGGSYKEILAQDLGAMVLKECIKRAKVDKEKIDEVVIGNIMQYDPKGNPAREAALKADIPIDIPAFTINKNCGSSMRAVNLASSLIKAREGDIYLAAGMENMTRCPYLLRKARFGYRMGDGVISDSLTDGLVGMGMTAERLAEKYNISRKEQDEFAYESQRKAKEAADSGVFKEEILPIKIETRKESYILSDDEGVKYDSSIEGLSNLKPVFKEKGTVTAGNSSTINDGAAAILVVSETALNKFQNRPLAEIVSYASVGCDPKIMGIGPVPATKKALKIAGLNIEDIDLIELNEAFAAQSLAVIKELNLDMRKVNLYGSGISLGHPVGATGAIIITKLAYQLKRLNKKYGLATMCIGGGQGIAIVIKNTQFK